MKADRIRGMDDLCRAFDDLAFLRIDNDDLARWAAVARKLEPVTSAVFEGVVNLHGDPCRERLAECANAARFAAGIADEPDRTIAVALAEDFERRATRGH